MPKRNKDFKHLATHVLHKPGSHIRDSPHGLPNLDKMPLCSLVNSRGGGKTTLAGSFLRQYINHPQMVEPGKPVFDRIFMVSPTYEMNKHVWDSLGHPINPSDIYLAPTMTSINSVTDKIEDDFEDYKKYKEDLIRFDEIMDLIHKVKNINSLDFDDLIFMLELNFKRSNITNKYDREQPPAFLLIVDDCSHSKLYQSSSENRFINLCLRNRHYNCMILNCTQNWKTGMPLALRQNSSIIGIGRLKDENVKKSIYDELSDDLEPEEFNTLFDMATAEPYRFFMILQDFGKNDGKYRSNFDQVLDIDQIKNCSCDD